MTDQELIDFFLKELVSEIAYKFRSEIEFIILFGSASRGDFKKGVSDIDLVIQLKTIQKREEILDYSTKKFWDLNKKYNTEFEKVISTTSANTNIEALLKNIEKKTHLYVPIFVFPPGWINWEKGKINRPLWKIPAIFFISQSMIFYKFKKEGKILFGKDIKKEMQIQISFWERFKSIQVPFWISNFAIIILPLSPNNSLKYAIKAILYELDSALFFLKLSANSKDEKINKLKQKTEYNFKFDLFNFHFSRILNSLKDKDFSLFQKAIEIKYENRKLNLKENIIFVFRVYWFILRNNWRIFLINL